MMLALGTPVILGLQAFSLVDQVSFQHGIGGLRGEGESRAGQGSSRPTNAWTETRCMFKEAQEGV